jgi:excisionase family DNA binding protein
MIMTIHTKNDQVLTIREAAEYLNYSEHTVRTYIRRNLINAGKFGSAVTILKSECDRFSREKRPPGRPSEKN